MKCNQHFANAIQKILFQEVKLKEIICKFLTIECFYVTSNLRKLFHSNVLTGRYSLNNYFNTNMNCITDNMKKPLKQYLKTSAFSK